MSSKSNNILILKFLFLIFNGIWIFCGIALVLIGALLKTNIKLIIGDGMEMVIKRVPNSTVIIFIAIGLTIVFVSMFANYGSVSSDTRVLYAFCVINILLLVVEFVNIGIASKFSEQLTQKSEKNIIKAIQSYKWDRNETAIDYMQKSLKCCGALQFKDWELNDGFNGTHPLFPNSCCHNSKRHLSECNTERVKHNKGCVEAISLKYRHRVLSLVSISVVIALFQIILILLALNLVKQLKNYETI